MIAEVIVDVLNSELDRVFDYKIPEGFSLQKGLMVVVSFGKRSVSGYVVGIKEKSDFDEKMLKEILEVKTECILPEMMELMDFMVEKYNLRKVDCLRLFILNEIRTNKIKGVKKRLPPSSMDVKDKTVKLNAEQNRAINEICRFENKIYLLHGVTGSGKTEVYMHCISEVIKKGKTAILLVPEISLTPQMLGNLKARFGESVAIIHSMLSSGEKFDEWKKIQNGEAKIVVGARSAIFAPIQNVGLIVIDEEHEGSYNSDSNPRYKTIDIAKFRQSFHKCPLVLGSATPSIETYYETQKKNPSINLLELPLRISGRDMPEVQIVDMTVEMHRGNTTFVSIPLYEELQKCFAKGRQALLFLNRRGYTSFLRCENCGYIAKCTDCDANLVYHKTDNKLICHYCGKRYKALTECPECHSKYIREGAVGTQQVVQKIEELFPNIPVFRMDNDTTKVKNGHQKILEEFEKTSPSVLVGTQMIAKGHDFSKVDVVGIIDADQSLYQSDFRSAEKTFELLTQVSGRAGRKDGGGKVILQTYNPKHYVYKFASNYNYRAFYEKEINVREVTKYPPFSTIVRVLISHEKEEKVLETTKKIYEDVREFYLTKRDDFCFFDAMKSPHARIKNKFRYQILLRFTKDKECVIIKQIYSIVNKFKTSKCNIFVEINPSNLG